MPNYVDRLRYYHDYAFRCFSPPMLHYAAADARRQLSDSWDFRSAAAVSRQRAYRWRTNAAPARSMIRAKKNITRSSGMVC
jgi:hypothetical protein